MARTKPRYFTTRPGKDQGARYFWQPSKDLQKLRWKLVRLSDRVREAEEQAAWINTILDAWRENDAELTAGLIAQWQAGGAGNNHGLLPCPFVTIIVPGLTIEANLATLPAAVSVKSVSALIDAFKDSEEWCENISPRTRKDYELELEKIRAWAGDIPVLEIRKKRIRQYHKALRRAHSLGTANKRLRVLSLLFSYAVNEEWIELDPTKRLKFRQTSPRVVIWRRDEEEAMIRACDENGRPEIADLIIAGADLGQRETDLFHMNDGQWDGTRWRLRQGKRGAIVYPEPTPRLLARIAAMRERRKLIFPKLVTLNPADRLLFINENTGARWNQSTFCHEFNRLRAIAAKSQPSLVARMQSDKTDAKATKVQFLDLRDTCVTRKAIAGATIAQIRATTGHTIGSIQGVLQHYLGHEPELAAESAKCLTALLDQIEAEQKAA